MEGDIFLKPNMFWNYAIGLSNMKFENPVYTTLHKIYRYFWLLAGFSFLFVQYYEIRLFSRDDPEMISENLRINFLMTFSLCKYFRCKAPITMKLLAYIRRKEQGFAHHEDPQIRRIFHRIAKYNKYICNGFQAFGYFTLTFFELHPVVYEQINPVGVPYEIINNVTVYKARPLQYGGDFPFDKYKYYNWAYGLFVWMGYFLAACTITSDTFMFSLMIYGDVEIQILQYRLRHFKEIALRSVDKGCTIEERNRNIALGLRSCIQEHSEIIEYVDQLNQCLKWLMFVDSALTSIVIAVIGLGIVVQGFGVQQMLGIEYLFWTILQLFLFYWFANKILVGGYGLQDAIWESQWYECDERVKKMLIFVMMRTRKPLALFVGPIYIMSINSTISILKTAVSYLALLRQMYE